MARLSHKRVMEIKLTVAKSALRQMKSMADWDIKHMEAALEEGMGGSIRSDKVLSMLRQFKNLAYFTLNDLEAPDEQITGLSHG